MSVRRCSQSCGSPEGRFLRATRLPSTHPPAAARREPGDGARIGPFCLSRGPFRGGAGGQGSDGLVNAGAQVVGAELFQDCAVLEVVVDQVRRPGDPDGHSPLPELGGQIPQRLQPCVVDVGHGGGVEVDRVDRAGRGASMRWRIRKRR
jgi:hypothetical protein